MPRVVDLGRGTGLRHFLLGSTPVVAAGVESALLTQYPGVEIAGRHSPPFGDNATAEPSTLDAIRAARPDVVWCALGAPKQELWMHRCAPLLPDVLFLGVGAAFDFLADTKQRAPQWMRERGLEWLHRLATEPARLGSRYFRTNTEFLIRSGLELTRQRLTS
jgi:N-acetylglucosaminyldiphosphoundecaprenol N-acetyl-beta-D-mannosaminyltransferase